MTKIDRVSKGKDERDVSQEDFNKREHLFIKALGLVGVTTRYLPMSNYCDDTDQSKERLTSTIPVIDAPLLQFMTQVCDPAITVTAVNPKRGLRSRLRDRFDEIQLNLLNSLHELDESQLKGITYGFVVIIVGIFIWYILLKLFT